MNNIYLGLFLSLICVILAYFLLSKLLIVSLFCVILAAIYFKDDFSLFRYLATHVASFYQWIFESYYYLLNMYHQSNNTNFPVRKPLQNNGTVSNKLHNNRYKQNLSHNLTSLYRREDQSSPHLNSSPSISPIPANTKAHSLLKDTPNVITGLTGTSKTQEDNLTYNRLNQYSGSVKSSFGLSPHSSPLPQRKNNLSGPLMDNVYSVDNSSGKIYSKVLQSPVDAKLYANVTSPGFCSRIAEGLSETMTHQSKYDSVGAFPVVHLTNQSPKVKIKTPVRVRIAPPTNELLYSSVANNSFGRSPNAGGEDSMKSVLQVLKEISRKRIHSNIEDIDCEENSKRLRISEAQLSGQSMLQSSLLQQTIQGKRAREETSPGEDDFKKKRKPLQNNEILSSLSSSMAVQPPHLKTKKRKAPAIDDSISSTPVLGKLLKVQAEASPPASISQSLAPAPLIEDIKKNSPAYDSLSQPKASPRVSSAEATQVGAPELGKATEASPVSAKLDDDDSSVSRLLGRMSGHSERPVPPRDIPVTKDPFMTTNDLSLSPPKENRLAAMIAVLGGPSENLDLDNFKAEPLKLPELKGKALFTSPDIPDTPKQKKNVTFSESLTSTKLFDKEEIPSTVSSSLVPNATPLSSLTFGGSSATTSVPKLDFGSSIVNSSMPVSLNFGSPLSAIKTTPTTQHDLNKATNPTTANALPSTESGLFPFQINKTSTAVASSPTTSVVSSSIGDSKPPAYTFGSSNSLPSNKESTPTQPSSTAAPMFSFGSESKTSQATTNTSITSIFASANAENNTLNSTDLIKTETNKTSFSLASSKDPSNDNKQMINGFTSNMNSPFVLNAPVSQANTNKPAFPGFGSTTTSSLPASQAAPMFSFGSVPQSTAESTSQSTGASVTTVPQPLVSSNSQNTGIFAAQSKPSMFNINSVAPTQNSVFGNTTAQVVEPLKTQLNSSAPTAAQGSSIFGSTTQASMFGNVSSSNTPSITSDATQNGSLFGDSKPSVFGAGGIVPSTQTNSSMFGSSSATSQGNSAFGITLGNAASPASTLFGKPTTAQTATSLGITTENGSTQSASLFSSSTGQTFGFTNQNSQTIKSMFSTTTATPSFGVLGNTSIQSFGAQKESATLATFGGQSSAPAFTFGSQSNGTVASFGNQINTSSAPTFGGQTPAPTFGSQANTPAPTFGSQTNTPAPTFGSQTNAPPPTFGSQAITSGPTFGSQSSTTAPTFGSQGNSSATTFGSQVNTSVATFGSQSNSPAPTFGNQIIKPSPAFGSQNNAAPPTFGSQNNAAPPTFGSQTNSTPTFSSQNNSSSTSQGGFGSPGTFNLSTTNTNEVKPPTFAFGSNKEPTKPFGASGPFSFGSSAQTPATNAVTPAPSFGMPNASPAFGASQQPPTFNAGATQPAGPIFAFGQGAPAPTFQFNAAAPQPAPGGGMFSIGSGTAAPRSKTGASRRRHKLT